MNQSKDNKIMRVLDIVSGTSVDGPGLRTSVYFAGCTHHCPECHNPQSWDPNAGDEYTVEEIASKILYEQLPATFSGGDPIMQLLPLTSLAKILHQQGVNIWCYTGYTFDALVANPVCEELLKNIDVVVDGPFLINKRNTSLLFRGSENQRLVDVRKSLSEGKIVEWHEIF